MIGVLEGPAKLVEVFLAHADKRLYSSLIGFATREAGEFFVNHEPISVLR